MVKILGDNESEGRLLHYSWRLKNIERRRDNIQNVVVQTFLNSRTIFDIYKGKTVNVSRIIPQNNKFAQRLQTLLMMRPLMRQRITWIIGLLTFQRLFIHNIKGGVHQPIQRCKVLSKMFHAMINKLYNWFLVGTTDWLLHE